jgi:hypothetical protein
VPRRIVGDGANLAAFPGAVLVGAMNADLKKAGVYDGVRDFVIKDAAQLQPRPAAATPCGSRAPADKMPW